MEKDHLAQQRVFRAEGLRPLDWNWVNAHVASVSYGDHESPVPLDYFEDNEWHIKTTFTPPEVLALREYMADHSELILSESTKLAGHKDPQVTAEELERSSRFLVKAVTWLGQAAATGNEVTVVEVPEGTDFITW